MDAVTAADRTRRQSTADHAGRESRIEAVTRDLVADVEWYGETTEQNEGQS